ncbi:hypothetical protein ARN13_15500, partial [Listeria monocytogenes]|nr:hypothetical protein [Listeria monocytogenes]EAD2232107.1 hypothetical protein [Listeria monocytogenes]
NSHTKKPNFSTSIEKFGFFRCSVKASFSCIIKIYLMKGVTYSFFDGICQPPFIQVAVELPTIAFSS